ncbi:Protein of unknown function, partial [Gryllus bimaculatus]
SYARTVFYLSLVSELRDSQYYTLIAEKFT